MISTKRSFICFCIAFLLVFVYYLELLPNLDAHLPTFGKQSFRWKDMPQNYPVDSFTPLPPSYPESLPTIQHRFKGETAEEKDTRLVRREAVKLSFSHAWAGYKQYAWGDDEVIPLGGGSRTVISGWAGTLVDSLDTLWIMDMKSEFKAAVREVARIDFTCAAYDTINLFETTIRSLGGLLSAYDLSGERILLSKATELGDMLYTAFDTPNRMPKSRWNWRDAKEGIFQAASKSAVSAEVGSMSLEFSRLSQLTGDAKYFDAIQRITDTFQSQQNDTALPGMWPIAVNPRQGNFSHGTKFSVSAMADSLYEYLPKEHMLLGGGRPEYMQMYNTFIDTAKEHIFYRLLNPDNFRLQLPGLVNVQEDGRPYTEPEGQHLGCFIGGLVAIGAKLRGSSQDLEIARELTDGCVWAYSSMPSGIMPEIFHAVKCSEKNGANCTWSDKAWHTSIREYAKDELRLATSSIIIQKERLQPGFSAIKDKRYLLRPEAIESVFVLYRITGDRSLLDRGWEMFQAVERATRTDIANTEVADVTMEEPPHGNKMESFWTAETLKYYFLLFSDPELISLDEYVFNTEAHPFRYRPGVKRRGSWW